MHIKVITPHENYFLSYQIL